ncbi:MAG TPA: hypothetical protein PKE69_13585 [Pyrinomonadaceae bacterium]|nr:hypothetical protein [Pyrinomonadaceae bacterium]
MNEKDEQLQKLMKLVEKSSFNHLEEITQGLKIQTITLESKSNNEVPALSLLDIYKHRANGLAQRHKSFHSQRLVKDMLAFCENLAKFPDEKISFWRLRIDESWSYTIFEGIESNRILGCILTADKRFVSEEEWEKIWNN